MEAVVDSMDDYCGLCGLATNHGTGMQSVQKAIYILKGSVSISTCTTLHAWIKGKAGIQISCIPEKRDTNVVPWKNKLLIQTSN